MGSESEQERRGDTSFRGGQPLPVEVVLFYQTSPTQATDLGALNLKEAAF
jgi:hypothetical protein